EEVKEILHHIYITDYLSPLITYLPNVVLSFGIFKVNRKENLDRFFNPLEQYIEGYSYIYVKENIPNDIKLVDYVKYLIDTVNYGNKSDKDKKNEITSIVSNIYHQIYNFKKVLYNVNLELPKKYF